MPEGVADNVANHHGLYPDLLSSLILSMPISDPNKIALVSVSSSVRNSKMQFLIARRIKCIYICMIQYRLYTGNSKPISRIDNLVKKTNLKQLIWPGFDPQIKAHKQSE